MEFDIAKLKKFVAQLSRFPKLRVVFGLPGKPAADIFLTCRYCSLEYCGTNMPCALVFSNTKHKAKGFTNFTNSSVCLNISLLDMGENELEFSRDGEWYVLSWAQNHIYIKECDAA